MKPHKFESVYELVWVDDVKSHPGLAAAHQLNQQLAKEKEKQSGQPS